jgi:conjugal transfer/type IV secretion protein DotA/TraY
MPLHFPHIEKPTVRETLGYMMLPRILPRLYEIRFRFAFVAQLMAYLYAWIGLIPPYHPYLTPSNAGTYSVRQVMTEAARHIRFSLKHIDQIIMYGILTGGFLLLIIQFICMIGFFILGVAYAQTSDTGMPLVGIFTTPFPENDIAFMLLDRVFGVPGFFNSCIALTNVTCDPTSENMVVPEPSTFPDAFQIGLQSLFAYYSMGALVIGGFIVCYFIGVVILESVQTGVPFGKRFASAYAPIRLCLAVLALVPIPMGTQAGMINSYNAAQYLTLYIAKLGSSFGTNGWNVFNNYFVIGGVGVSAPNEYSVLNPGARATETSSPSAATIARPQVTDVDPLLQFMFLAHACRAMVDIMPPGDLRPKDSKGNPINVDHKDLLKVEPYITTPGGKYKKLSSDLKYADALDFAKSKNMHIRFGLPESPTQIAPFCGELRLQVNSFAKDNGATWYMEKQYDLLANMWENETIKAFGDRIARIYIATQESTGDNSRLPGCNIPVPNDELWGTDLKSCGDFPAPLYYNTARDAYQKVMDFFMDEARERQIALMNKPIDNRMLSRGWAGAGIWYNRLAEMNGTLFDAARALPIIMSMPKPMEDVDTLKRSSTHDGNIATRYLPQAIDGNGAKLSSPEISNGLGKIYAKFQDDAYKKVRIKGETGNALFDLMNSLFGTSVLFDMRKNQDVNPMVQLLALGKSIVDTAFFNILAGTGTEFAIGMISQLEGYQKLGAGAGKLTNAWFSIATIGLGIGVLLYYVMPFIPFLYFFFAVVKWLQSIFEAMIGMPMWALAHLRIDGNGIPGSAASDGYFLLLEILIRPILTVIGLIASILIFTATVYTLNDTFNLVTVNLAAYTPPSTGSMAADLAVKRGTIDQFFYTVLYAILMYMAALSSFKLIDRIPENILRWAGSGAKNIIDDGGDPVPGLIQSTFVGSFGMPLIQSGGVVGQAIHGLRDAAKGTGALVGKQINDSQQKSNKKEDEK